MRVLRPVAAHSLACALACAAILTGLAEGAAADPVGPSGQTPSQSQVDQANQDADDARAALTPAQADLVAAQRRLASLETAARRAQQRSTRADADEQAVRQAAQAADAHARQTAAFAAATRTVLGRLVAEAYRDGAALDLDSLTIVLDAKDPQQYLSGAHVVRRLMANQASILTQSQDAEAAAAGARTRADQDAAKLRATQVEVARSSQAARQAADAAQAQVGALGARVDELLAEQQAAQGDAAGLARQRQAGLSAAAAQQQAAEDAAGGDAPTGSGPAGRPGAALATGPAQQFGTGTAGYSSDLAGHAIAYALAQLGKPYVWGGTGPGSFDCSGLAMRAYQSAGIGLPHFAAFQYQASHPLTYDRLRPGDLLFWATDPGDADTIYHEAIYLGGRKMVQAPKTGWNVMVSDMWMWGPIQFYARPY